MPGGVLTKTFACLAQLSKRQKERFRREICVKLLLSTGSNKFMKVKTQEDR